MKFIVYTASYLISIFFYIKQSLAGTVGYMHFAIHHIGWNLPDLEQVAYPIHRFISAFHLVLV